ncbi:hypothetical protein E4U55_004523 [Claviceps digitariae]|nr:hypothetical protein E4U55_004523 [Claviceps digitariae]
MTVLVIGNTFFGRMGMGFAGLDDEATLVVVFLDRFQKLRKFWTSGAVEFFKLLYKRVGGKRIKESAESAEVSEPSDSRPDMLKGLPHMTGDGVPDSLLFVPWLEQLRALLLLVSVVSLRETL